MTMPQFIDLCILCGCDYTCNIAGVGPIKAFNYIQATDGTIEGVMKRILEDNDNPKKKQKYVIPKNFMYQESRRLFVEPDVTPAAKFEFKWEKADEESVKKFLCESKGFTEQRIEAGLKRLAASLGKSNQSRLDTFFGKAASKPATTNKENVPKPSGNLLAQMAGAPKKAATTKAVGKKSQPVKKSTTPKKQLKKAQTQVASSTSTTASKKENAEPMAVEE